MNEEEKQQLAQTVVKEMDLLRPEDLRPWLLGFISTHPRELVFEVNVLVKDDPVFKDIGRRMAGWNLKYPKTLVSWTHVSPETEASLRDAASWRSAPLSARANQTGRCRDASALWGDRATLNKKGVALLRHAPEPQPWPGEVDNVVTVVTRLLSGYAKDVGIVLCDDGQVLEGLPTWPRP